MQYDQNYILDDNVAITTTRDSTNVLLLGNANESNGNPLYVDVLVTQAFTAGGAATLDVELQSSPDGSAWTSELKKTAIPKATLVAGYKVQFVLPPVHGKYIKCTYTVGTGPMTAGKVQAALLATQNNAP